MNILLIGPGAIGCLFASSIARAGHSVQLFDKDKNRANSLNKKGITIKNASAYTVRLNVITHPTEANNPDYICICVKSYDTASAAHIAGEIRSPDTFIVSIQNGIGNCEVISGICQTDKVICVATSQGATISEPGVITHAGFGPTAITALNPNNQLAARRFADMLSSSGIIAETREDILSMLWSKLIINAAINPITALYNIPNGALLNNKKIKGLMLSAAKEAEEVAHTMCIKLDFDNSAEAVERVCLDTQNNISSMLQDVRAGKRPEIEAITGAVIQSAEKVGVDAPVNRDLLMRINKLSKQVL